MSKHTSEVTKIKRKVWVEVAKLAWEGNLKTHVDSLPHRLTKDGVTHYRCCEYKERAILADRIRLALGATGERFSELRLSDVVELIYQERRWEESTDGSFPEQNLTIVSSSCDRCPIDKIVVTNACRNCVAHHCVNACPKGAIQIISHKAFVDATNCSECGLCTKACSYGAILKVERPCERVCAVGAIQPGEHRSALIDEKRCIECGACVVACPFGAVSEVSQLVDVIHMLLSNKKVWAVIAPSFAGQFGPRVSPEAFVKACLELGFCQVMEVAAGADETAAREATELQSRLQEGHSAMTSSCCPAFLNLVHKHYPSLRKFVSDTPSPMLLAAKAALDQGADQVVFIGPCLAKKGEARSQGAGIVRAVLTFEEVAALFVARGLNLATIEGGENLTGASSQGRGFAISGGVAAALQNALGNEDFHPMSANGITECERLLKALARGKLEGNFLEGMVCEGGCVGGPGCLVGANKSGAAVKRLSVQTTELAG